MTRVHLSAVNEHEKIITFKAFQDFKGPVLLYLLNEFVIETNNVLL